MASPSDSDRIKALDLGSEDWTMLYELAFWLGPDDEATDYDDLVSAAQAVLLSLLDDGLAEVAEVRWVAQQYDVASGERARAIVDDIDSWRTAVALDEAGSPVLFSYAATEAGRRVYFGSGV